MIKRTPEEITRDCLAADYDTEEVDEFGNPPDRIIYCCYANCGCPEARLCMAENGFGSGIDEY